MTGPTRPQSFGGGFLLGALVAGATVIAWSVTLGNQESWSSVWPYAKPLLRALSIAIPLVGYAGGTALAVRRSTRSGGLGMVVGLTLMTPCFFALSVLLFFYNPS